MLIDYAQGKVGKHHLSYSTEPEKGMSKKSKTTIQPTLSFLLKRKTKESGEKKEIGGSSSEKTSLEEKKEPKKLKPIEVHDFHIDDTNIDSQTSSSSSSLSSTSLVSFSNVGNSLRVRVSLQNLLTLQKLQPVRHIQLM